MKKGQIVLFVIVLLTIALIIISAAVSRTLVNVKNNNINTDSTRAFNAAESGIDELLKRGDLAAIAGNGTQYNINSVDKSTFNEAKYQVENVDSGYFGLISKDTSLQIEFASDPDDMRINYSSDACLELSLYSNVNNVNTVARRIICGSNVGTSVQNAETGNDDTCDWSSFPASYANSATSCKYIPFTSANLLLIKVLKDDSEIKLVADNYQDSFATKPIKATSWATTKSGVRKEVQISTKTTNDIFPVFDNALYIR